jgi:phthiodiolone/phenolphthiodiolone dimycocerosates ketoreductase
MKVGLVFSPMFPSATAAFAVSQADELGLDSLWTIDHLMGTVHPDLWPVPESDPDGYLDPFCLIAALGQSTAIPFGTCVTDSLRRGAADMARTALSLNHLCRGGFKLGIGSGEAENLIPFGYSFERPVGRTEELLPKLRQLLDDGTYPGTHGRMGLPLENETGRPEIWLAAHGPRMLRLAGQYADGWIPAFISSPEQYASKREIMAGHAAAAGRPVPQCGLQPFTILGESKARLQEMFEAEPVAKLFALFREGEHWERHGLEHPLGNESRGFVDVVVHDLDPEMLRDLAPRIPFELLEDVIFMGNAQEIAEQLAPFGPAGLEHLIVANMTGIVGGAEEFMARVAEFPRLIELLRQIA